MTTDIPAAHPTPPTIHGRDAEIGQIRACLREASAGRGRLILVGGEAGIGKTALVETAARAAEAGGARVARGACYDPATPPHGPWIEALEDLAAQGVAPAIPNLFDTHGVPVSPTTIREAQARFLAFLIGVASEQPLIIILEDLHWADPDSLALTRHLARALARHPLAVIMTYRDVELAPEQPLHRYLPHLVRESRPLRISLQRFGPDEIREVVRHRYVLDPRDESRLVVHLYEHAEGNPFFTEELLRSLEHERILARDGDRWVLGDTALAPVPLLVRQMIDARVAWMDATARALLQIAAVIGAEVPLALWRDVARIGDIALATAIEQARDAQIIAPSPSRPAIRFTHALVREAVYDAITPPRRHVWHRQVAEMLAGRDGAGADLVAYHFQQAGDRRAAAWLQRAAVAAMQSNAVEDAVERFEAALAVLRDDPSAAAERATILAHLADARRYSDPAQALAYLDEARFHVAASGDRALEAIVLWSRARIRGFLGEVTLDDLREALEAYRSLETADRDRIHAIGGRLGSGQGPFAQWLAHHGVYRDAIEVGLSALDAGSGTPGARSDSDRGHAWLGLALAWAGAGRPTDARAAFADARQLFLTAGHRFMAAAALKWQIIELALTWDAGDLAGRDALLAEYDRIWWEDREARGDSGGRRHLPLFPPLIIAGRWSEAREAAESYLSDSYLRVDCLAALAEIDRNQGRTEDAWRRITGGLPAGPATESSTPFYVRSLALMRVAVELALDDGDLDLARAWLDAHERWLESSGRVLDRPAAEVLAARLHELAGDLDAAREHAAAAISLASGPCQPLALAEAHRAAGRVARLASQADAAREHLALAATLAGDAGSSPLRARVLLERAELDLDCGDASDAERALDAAIAVLEPLDAAPALRRAAALREALGRSGRRASVPFGLSAREVEVLALVARGMTDNDVAVQLYISPRTVARHLQSIYNKLGVSSRTAATAIGYDHGLVSPASIGPRRGD